METFKMWCLLFVEPESSPGLCAPTKMNTLTVPHYCCRQLSLMRSRVSETQQLLQMALLPHLALPPASTGGGKLASDPHLCKRSENIFLEFSTIWSQHFPKIGTLKAWEWWTVQQNNINIYSFSFWCVFVNLKKINLMFRGLLQVMGRKTNAMLLPTHMSDMDNRTCWVLLNPMLVLFMPPKCIFSPVDRECQRWEGVNIEVVGSCWFLCINDRHCGHSENWTRHKDDKWIMLFLHLNEVLMYKKQNQCQLKIFQRC